MNQPTSIRSNVSQAEETLRLVAALPAPDGLEDRIHAALRADPRKAKVLPWPANGGLARQWMRGAAAAAIVCVVAGGGWGIYMHVRPSTAFTAPELPRMTGSGDFSSAGAMRTPQTLNAPKAATQPQTSTPTPTPQAKTAKKPARARSAQAPHSIVR